MPRLIDADDLYQHKVVGTIDNLSGDFIPGYVIAMAQTIEAEPVRHGRWIPCGNDPFDSGMFYCSACEDLRYFDEELLTSEEAEKCAYYCPNCGAKMDLKE